MTENPLAKRPGTDTGADDVRRAHQTEAEGAVNPATCDEFDLGLPRLDDPVQRFDCLLTAAPNGLSVTGVFYDGTFAREGDNVDPTAYLDSPVSWRAP